MGLKRTIFVSCVVILTLAATNSYSAWQGPTEFVSGVWGNGDSNFGIERGDTSDQLPNLTAVIFDGKTIISDEVNKREVVYNSDGTLYKVIPWYIVKNGSKIVNPDYPLYKYWNVQGYTPEGNIWFKIDKYSLKSPSGQLIKTSTTRPLELGVVSEKALGNGQYKVTVKYPDKEWSIIGRGVVPKYTRDMNGNLYGSGEKQAIRYNSCGKELARLTMPDDKIETVSQGEQVEPNVTVLEGYGSPVIAPNGDVYTWKRTPDKYSILKWTWVDDPNVPTGPEPPSGLAVTPSINGLYLTWKASPNDPGCVTKYEIARATTSGGVFSTIDTVEKGVLKYNDTTAETGTTYYYKVRAMAGSDPSAYTAEVSGKR